MSDDDDDRFSENFFGVCHVTPPHLRQRQQHVTDVTFDETSESGRVPAGEFASGDFEEPPIDGERETSPTMLHVTPPRRPLLPDPGPANQFLATYAQADLAVVPSREKFAEIVVNAFNKKDDDIVQQWVCSLESHRVNGVHYHLALKLRDDKRRRKAQVGIRIHMNNKIHVHFKDWTTCYWDAYRYVSKLDPHHIKSEGHVDLVNPPRTANASRARKRISMERAEALATGSAAAKEPTKKPLKPVLLRKEDVGRIVIANDIHDDDGLCALAQAQLTEGKNDLETFLYRHSKVSDRESIIATAWKMAKSKERADRAKKTRIQLLEEALLLPCASDEDSGASCDGRWLPAALEVLERNNYTREYFSSLITNCLRRGRGKGRNLMIIGGTNCAKTFMVMPLVDIYDTFCSPAKGSFNWVGADKKELLLLNDIRYGKDGESKVMAWQELLNLLDGSPLAIDQPKCHFAANAEWRTLQPIIATSDGPIERIMPDGRKDTGETNQMVERWVRLDFAYKFNSPDYSLLRCARCFASLVLEA